MMENINLTRRSLLGVSLGALAASPAAAESALPQPIAYQTMANTSVQLRPFAGRNVALLLDPARQAERVVIDRILAVFDRAWDWYGGYFGRSPAPYKSHAGRTVVAEVPSPRVVDGRAGIELASSTVDLLLSEAVHDRYNQATFFIMGRNFWAYDLPLGQIGAFKLPASNGVVDLCRFDKRCA